MAYPAWDCYGQSSPDGMALVYSQAYGYNFYMQLIKKDFIDFANLSKPGLAATGGFLDTNPLVPNTGTVTTSGTGDTFGIAVGTGKTITNAALASNVVTLTFGAAHGFAQGDRIVVSGLPSPFTSLNGGFTVATATTSSPFTVTYALTGANITSAAVAAGTATLGLKLNGTDNAIRLLGLTNAAPEESENEETIVTYDDEVKSFDTSIATSKSFSWTIEGVTDHSDVAYKLLRIGAKESVREGLMVKYARVGPTGKTETTYGYGRLTGFSEQPPAGGIVKWSSSIRAYGPYELTF